MLRLSKRMPCQNDMSHLRPTCPSKPVDPCAPTVKSCGSANKWLSLLIWYVVAVVVIYVILHLVAPSWVKKTQADGSLSSENDPGKLLMWSVVFALVLFFVLYLIKASCGVTGGASGYM